MDELIPRRDLLATALASAALGAGIGAEGTGREYYELRRYRLRRGPMQKRADDYFRDALLPAVKRLSLGPVGVFSVSIGSESPTAVVIIPHPSADSAATLSGRLARDDAYLKAGAAFLEAPATDPSYLSIESSLLLAFEKMPRLEPPAAKNQPRIFELRTYRSHSEAASLKKIEMFNGLPGGSETAIFRRVGLAPVFFGQMLVGQDMPCFTYMLTFPDLATRERNWNAFRNDPAWMKLGQTPGYTDPEIVSAISSTILSPAAYSEI